VKQGERGVEAPRFSKGQVNRAGVFLLELRERVRVEGAERALRATDAAAIEAAVRRWSGGAACTHDRCRRSLRTCATTS
jgi:hypothetical protein